MLMDHTNEKNLDYFSKYSDLCKNNKN